MIEVYQLMKQSRVAPTFEILHLVSRGTRHMDHRCLYHVTNSCKVINLLSLSPSGCCKCYKISNGVESV